MLPRSKLVKKQTKTYDPKEYTENGEKYKITARVRYDDECGNGYNSFSITADIDTKRASGRWYEHSGGCCHDEIKKHFPVLAPFLKWHLCSSDGPRHYVANTTYQASNRDCYGFLKGEPRYYEERIQFGSFPILYEADKEAILFLEGKKGPFGIWEVEHKKDGRYSYSPRYTFAGYDVEWHKCPFDSRDEAERFNKALTDYPVSIVKTATSWSEGKEPDLEAARSCAIWPEAALGQLQSKKVLEARLPALMKEFKKDVEALGLIY